MTRGLERSHRDSTWLRWAAGLALIVGLGCGCKRPALAAQDARDAKEAGRAPSAAKAETSPGYPVDTRPPKDFFSDRLLRTLAREASATVVCRLSSLTDVFPEHREPDIFYDAACDVIEVIAGSSDGKPLHFIWQVERDARMPPPQSELLVYLKARKEPLDGPPALKWVALDTGVMRYTPALRDRMHRQSKKTKKK
jgi:hypothetical protein